MVRSARNDGMNPVNLLKQHNQREFMLHGQPGEGHDMVALFPQFFGVPVRRADQKSDAFNGMKLPMFCFVGKLTRCPQFAPFIKGDPQTAF